jgi:hypothetical protein
MPAESARGASAEARAFTELPGDRRGAWGQQDRGRRDCAPCLREGATHCTFTDRDQIASPPP